MNRKPIDRNYITGQFIAALRGIVEGKKLSEPVVVLGDIGRKVKIGTALANAASHFSEPAPDDCGDLIMQACKMVEISPSNSQMNEIARAIFDALRAAKK